LWGSFTHKENILEGYFRLGREGWQNKGILKSILNGFYFGNRLQDDESWRRRKATIGEKKERKYYPGCLSRSGSQEKKLWGLEGRACRRWVWGLLVEGVERKGSRAEGQGDGQKETTVSIPNESMRGNGEKG